MHLYLFSVWLLLYLLSHQASAVVWHGCSINQKLATLTGQGIWYEGEALHKQHCQLLPIEDIDHHHERALVLQFDLVCQVVELLLDL